MRPRAAEKRRLALICSCSIIIIGGCYLIYQSWQKNKIQKSSTSKPKQKNYSLPFPSVTDVQGNMGNDMWNSSAFNITQSAMVSGISFGELVNDTINSHCHCGNVLIQQTTNLKTNWLCECCFKDISKDIKPYYCNKRSSCIYYKVSGLPFKSCVDCFKSKDVFFDDTKSNDDEEQLFVYQKFQTQLPKIS